MATVQSGDTRRKVLAAIERLEGLVRGVAGLVQGPETFRAASFRAMSLEGAKAEAKRYAEALDSKQLLAQIREEYDMQPAALKESMSFEEFAKYRREGVRGVVVEGRPSRDEDKTIAERYQPGLPVQRGTSLQAQYNSLPERMRQMITFEEYKKYTTETGSK